MHEWRRIFASAYKKNPGKARVPLSLSFIFIAGVLDFH